MTVAIDFTDCRLTSDKYNWIIQKRYVNKKTEEVYHIPESYHASIPAVAKALLKRGLLESDATTLQELVDLVQRVEATGVRITIDQDSTKSVEAV